MPRKKEKMPNDLQKARENLFAAAELLKKSPKTDIMALDLYRKIEELDRLIWFDTPLPSGA